MVKVSIKVRKGAARFRVSVQAESIGQAVSLVGGRHPKRNIRVKSARDPFAEDLAAIAGMVEQPERVAA